MTEGIIKYHATLYNGKIQERLITKETELSVWDRGHRRSKCCITDAYFDSWEEAKNYLLVDANHDLVTARLSLNRAQGRVGNIEGMKNPYEPEENG